MIIWVVSPGSCNNTLPREPFWQITGGRAPNKREMDSFMHSKVRVT